MAVLGKVKNTIKNPSFNYKAMGFLGLVSQMISGGVFDTGARAVSAFFGLTGNGIGAAGDAIESSREVEKEVEQAKDESTIAEPQRNLKDKAVDLLVEHNLRFTHTMRLASAGMMIEAGRLSERDGEMFSGVVFALMNTVVLVANKSALKIAAVPQAIASLGIIHSGYHARDYPQMFAGGVFLRAAVEMYRAGMDASEEVVSAEISEEEKELPRSGRTAAELIAMGEGETTKIGPTKD